MQRLKYGAFLMCAALGLSACQGQSSSAVGSSSGTGLLPLLSARMTHPDLGTGFIYVVNPTSNLITMYPKTGTGNIAPTADLSGSNTQLFAPFDVFVPKSGKIYVTNRTNNAVTVYPTGSTGNKAPAQDIFGHNTLMSKPSGIGTDSSGDIY